MSAWGESVREFCEKVNAELELRAPRKPTMTKAAAHYRHGTAEEHCGNCVMFHPGAALKPGRCDLVMGSVSGHMVCDHWEKRPE